MIEELTRYEALKLCEERAGSASQMARDLGVTQPRVWRWLNQSKQLPAEYVLRAEELYEVSRHCLRPDIYPMEVLPAHPRWCGVDMSSGPDIEVVTTVRRERNGNRINVLDVRQQRRTA